MMESNHIVSIDEICIGSWWEMADGMGKFGYCVIDKHPTNGDVIVLGTDGVKRNIDYFKLQYRYKKVVPNE